MKQTGLCRQSEKLFATKQSSSLLVASGLPRPEERLAVTIEVLVARVKRSATRGLLLAANSVPDFAALHPGYVTTRVSCETHIMNLYLLFYKMNK